MLLVFVDLHSSIPISLFLIPSRLRTECAPIDPLVVSTLNPTCLFLHCFSKNVRGSVEEEGTKEKNKGENSSSLIAPPHPLEMEKQSAPRFPLWLFLFLFIPCSNARTAHV